MVQSSIPKAGSIKARSEKGKFALPGEEERKRAAGGRERGKRKERHSHGEEMLTAGESRGSFPKPSEGKREKSDDSAAAGSFRFACPPPPPPPPPPSQLFLFSPPPLTLSSLVRP